MSGSNVYHVRGLEEALLLYARERLAGRPLPTFTMNRAEYERDKAQFDRSYTVNIRGALLRGVYVHVTPIDPPLTPTDFTLE